MAKTIPGIFAGELAVQFNGYLPEELHSWLVEQAHEESMRTGDRVTMSEIVRRAVLTERARIDRNKARRKVKAA